MKTAVIFLLAISLATFVIGFALSLFDYKRHTKVKYKVQNTFPYELAYYRGNTYTLYVRGLLITSFLAAFGYLILFYFTYAKECFYTWEFTSYFISGILYTIFALFTVLKNMNNIKIHLLMFTVMSTFGSLNFLTLCIPGLEVYDVIYRTVLSSISVVFALILVVLTFNPRLLNWAKLEEKRDEQGELSYVRPKVFILALTEWIFIFFLFISLIISYFMFI